jgi:hypothetical protein
MGRRSRGMQIVEVDWADTRNFLAVKMMLQGWEVK